MIHTFYSLPLFHWRHISIPPCLPFCPPTTSMKHREERSINFNLGLHLASECNGSRTWTQAYTRLCHSSVSSSTEIMVPIVGVTFSKYSLPQNCKDTSRILIHIILFPWYLYCSQWTTHSKIDSIHCLFSSTYINPFLPWHKHNFISHHSPVILKSKWDEHIIHPSPPRRFSTYQFAILWWQMRKEENRKGAHC